MSVFRTVAAATAVVLAGVLAPVFIASPAVAAPNCDLGGFEIDGDLPANCDPVQDDWDTVDAAVTSSGGTYSASSKDVNATSTWVAGGNAPDKADIDTAYTYAQVGEDGHYYLYVGWTRTSNTGTGKYAIELTFSEPNIVNTPLPTPQPDRADGGVVAYIEYQGSDLPLLGQLCEYTSQANYPASVNSDPDCTDDTTGFASAVSDDGFFFEVGFDLTEFAGIVPSCPPTIDVATMYLRSITGGSGDGNLKAFVDPLGVTPPSTCGFLDVTKESLNDLALDDPTVFDYEVSTGGDTVITDDLQIGDTDSFFTLEEGDYSLEETIPADAPWSIYTIVCGIGDELVTIYQNGEYTDETFPIVEGETTECFITNATSFVNVEKQTLPDGSPQVFDFTITDDQTFDLSDGQSEGFQFAPGTDVSVTEDVPSDWELTDVTCDPAGDSIENGAAVTTVAGETVDCVFTNTQDGTIIINKVVEGVDDGTFEFTSTSLGDFDITTVAGVGSEEFVVVPGEYDVAESPISGFDTTNLVCIDESGGTIVDLENFSADIDLAPGETVTCTFTNTQRGIIYVEKVTEPDAYDQDFNFTFDGNLDFTLNAAGDDEWDSGLIEPGEYTVSENDLPFGWTLDDISCGEVVDDTTVVVELLPGAVVNCVFTNVAVPGEVTLTKTVSNAGGLNWAFDVILKQEPDGAPVLQTVSNANLPASAVANWAGLSVGETYTLVEAALPANWTAGDITCTGLVDADAALAGFQFVVTPGLALECTVDNQAILAKTGSTPATGLSLALAMLLLAGGGAALLIRRKRRTA